MRLYRALTEVVNAAAERVSRFVLLHKCNVSGIRKFNMQSDYMTVDILFLFLMRLYRRGRAPRGREQDYQCPEVVGAQLRPRTVPRE